jgi:hypothetical protein
MFLSFKKELEALAPLTTALALKMQEVVGGASTWFRNEELAAHVRAQTQA